MNRNKAEKRFLDRKKAIRKRFITRNVYHLNEKDDDNGEEYYDNLHQYSKNKIHCSDGYTKKTNNRGRNKYYGQGCKLWKASDAIKVQRLEEQLYMEESEV
jgi:hypothetical protein